MPEEPETPQAAVETIQAEAEEPAKPDLEALIDAALERAQELQADLPCRENIFTLQHLRQAQSWNEARTEARETQGVKGSDLPHAGPHDFICSDCGARVEIHLH